MTKPHLYFFQGSWWRSRNGRDSFRKGITMNDGPTSLGLERVRWAQAKLGRRSMKRRHPA